MTTISKRTAASTDDAYDDNTPWPSYSATGTLIIGNADGDTLWTGVRITGVNIAAGSTINSCTLTVVRPSWDGAGNEDVGVFFEEAASPATFSSSDTPYDRGNGGATLTTATINWVLGADGGPGDVEVSPDLKTLLQEVVDDVGAQLNDIVILTSGNVSTARAVISSFDSAPLEAPLLDIDYTAGGGGGAPARRRRLGLLGVGG